MGSIVVGGDRRAWYLIQCKPRQDERAEENLLRQGYELYRPRLYVERFVKGRRKEVCESLFPGYIFIRFGLLDNWSSLRSTRGVTKVVAFGSYPLAVSDNLIDQLRLHENEPGVLPAFSVGDRVRIKDGPFAELEAIFLSVDGNERVILLLNFLHRQQRIRMPRVAITKD